MATNGNDPGSGHGNLSPEEREALRQRAAALGKRLDEVSAKRPPQGGPNGQARGKAFGEAFKIVAELVVGVAVRWRHRLVSRPAARDCCPGC